MTGQIGKGKHMKPTALAGAAFWIGIVTLAAQAQTEWPRPSFGADHLCNGYHDTAHGFWLDASGKPVLGFVFATNRDGSGCYAWLNAVPAWGIRGPGSDIMHDVQLKSESRQWGDSQNMISVDLASSTAKFIRNGRLTHGVIVK